MSDAATALSRNEPLTMPLKVCATCGVALGRSNRSGYCKAHFSAAQASDPVWREKQRAGAKRAIMADPVRRDAQRKRCRAFHRDPAITEKRREAAKRIRLWELGARNAYTAEANAKRGASRTATALAWCPPHLREEYRHLIYSKRIPAAEARAIILAQDAREVKAVARRLGVANENEALEVKLTRFAYSVKRIEPRDMVLIAANVLDLEPDDILSPSRLVELVGARAAICKALRERGMSFTAIAHAIGRTDHSTAIHAVAAYDDIAVRFPGTHRAYEAIKKAEAIAARLAA